MTNPICRLTDVEFAYPDGTKALDGLSLSVQPREKVGIIGPNGAGKSTLLYHLNGLLAPARGRVEVAGLEVNKKNMPEIRRRVGVVFQNPDDQLFCPTVFEDVAFGPRNQGLPETEVRARVEAALGVVGLQGFEGRSAHHLSFGQKKRAAIATVLSMRPTVWAFDEPTANLDPASQQAVETFIAGCPDTVFIVTQDLLFAAEVCERLVILDGGKVVLDGPVDDIVRRTEELARFGLGFTRACRMCRRIRGLG